MVVCMFVSVQKLIIHSIQKLYVIIVPVTAVSLILGARGLLMKMWMALPPRLANWVYVYLLQTKSIV